MLDYGEGVPSFTAAALNGNPRFDFHAAAGRPTIMLFLGSAGHAPCAQALRLVARYNAVFDDRQACFFGITADPSDTAEARIAARVPGIRWFLDYDRAVSRLYGAASADGAPTAYAPFWLLLDATQRVVRRAPIDQGITVFADLFAMLSAGPEHPNAPVLVVPRVLEPDLCRRLIDLYEQNGGVESGFMRQEGAVTVATIDRSCKKRSDCTIRDPALRELLADRLRRRLIPQLKAAFQFNATRIERWIVACYDGADGGFFAPHRDNTTSGTAHRNFACTINLNAHQFEGGELRFPEFGQRTYRAPTGGAVLFSCSLLHEATAVTRGKRYAFLPFFYDEAGAQVRRNNAATIVGAAQNAVASNDPGAHIPPAADRFARHPARA